MLHLTAIIECKIPESTNVWAFTHIMLADIGERCTIGEHVFIGSGVKIGDGCRIQNGALLYSGVTMGDDCLIGPGVVTTNDHYPELPVGDWKDRFRTTKIGNQVSIGANATIVCGVTLGDNCMVGAGAVVTKDVKANTIVVGNPARVLRIKK